MMKNIVMRIPGSAVDGQPVCCLGSQLARIVALLSDLLGDVVWYVADIDVIGEMRYIPPGKPSFIGNTHELIVLSQKVDQFLRGVFLAVKSGICKPSFRVDVETEDPVDVNLGDAVVEIRAFDTSWFEVLTTENQVIASLIKAFGNCDNLA